MRRSSFLSCQARPFDTLVFLVQHRDRVVDKQELLDNVWPEAHVEESALFQTISTLRKALGEGKADGERYIATVPGRGYRFVAETALVGSHETVAEGPANQEFAVSGSHRGRVVVMATVAAAATLGAVLWPLPKNAAPNSGTPTVTRLTSLEGVDGSPVGRPTAARSRIRARSSGARISS